MIDKLALQITSLICTEAYNNTKDRARIQYGLTVLLSEGFKIVFLLLFFNVIHKQNYFYFSLLIILSTRLFAGGLHLKGTLNCLIATTLLFTLTSVLAPLAPKLPVACYLLIGLISLVTVLIRAPIRSVVRPIKDNTKKLQHKFTAALLIAIWTIILLFLGNTTYVNCGFSTILVQSVLLVLVKKPKL
ncbi:accessory gene regulator B family protein [Clostridium sp. P21]|uniref:Accessory gene regulator B family protein n=1 Tax=Clostridium muellerianum TaxID=2716538 RepID=A0A7Y0EI44_9CLOT|nr:accessory gene regulator B family protein [Clostridium muellerianum]NMM63893.1 accessory gene regulator B family protein [Clostridium muellerianum]